MCAVIPRFCYDATKEREAVERGLILDAPQGTARTNSGTAKPSPVTYLELCRLLSDPVWQDKELVNLARVIQISRARRRRGRYELSREYSRKLKEEQEALSLNGA